MVVSWIISLLAPVCSYPTHIHSPGVYKSALRSSRSSFMMMPNDLRTSKKIECRSPFGRDRLMRIEDRVDLTLDLIDARQGLSDIRRRQVRATLLEQITLAVEEEREECARLADRMAEVQATLDRDSDTQSALFLAQAIRMRDNF